MHPSHCSPDRVRWIQAALFSLVLLTGEDVRAADSPPPPDPAAGEIQRRLADAGDILRIDNETLDAEALRRFYETRNWRPAWSGSADKVVAALAAADQEGLPLQPLHLPAIARSRQAGGAAKQSEADLLMTDGLLRTAAAMRGQRVAPAEIEDDWFLKTPPFDAVAFLKDNLADIGTALQTLAAPYTGYQLLRRKLAELRAVAAAGDWPRVPAGPPLKPGAEDERIPAVRRRLLATGELTGEAAGSAAAYDDTLLAAVRLFQRRHGLDDDGVLGPRTVAAMNVTAAERARQVAINMERWRWLPQRLEGDHIVVNVPGAWLEVVENGSAVLTMKVIVGDPDHPTPALHARMTSLVLNPVWRIPASIATDEILPKLKKDPGYLIANDLELVADTFPPGSPESQGVGIAWQDIATMPWPVRQKAGSDNALGRIKFNIPNDDDIYLHDTPKHRLFARAERALSHGCIRLEKPYELALYVLRDKDWTRQKLDEEIGRGDTRTVSLDRSLPVWLLYWTAWVDADGNLQVRDDLYGRDQRLGVALSKANHSPQIAVPDKTITPKVVNCDGCRLP